MKSNNFKNRIKKDILPFIDKMIQKEKNHLEWLIFNDAPENFINESSKSLEKINNTKYNYIKYLNK